MSRGLGVVERRIVRSLGKVGCATGPELCGAVFKPKRGEDRPSNAALTSVRRALRSLYYAGVVVPWPVHKPGEAVRWLRRKPEKKLKPKRRHKRGARLKRGETRAPVWRQLSFEDARLALPQWPACEGDGRPGLRLPVGGIVGELLWPKAPVQTRRVEDERQLDIPLP
jgi:hypothetical protein